MLFLLRRPAHIHKYYNKCSMFIYLLLNYSLYLGYYMYRISYNLNNIMNITL